MRRAALFAGLLALAWPAFAQNVTSDTRPVARAPVVVDAAPALADPEPDGQGPAIIRPVIRPTKVTALAPQIPVPTAQMRPSPRPYLRPELSRTAGTRAQVRADRNVVAISPYAVARSLRPTQRPAAITRRAVEQRVARARGQLCGDPAIQGESIGRVSGRGSCGVENAVRVRSVAGVTLQPAATIDCRTASALKAWVAQGAKPAVGTAGGGISSLRVVSHYACRFRNSASSGRLSEHAFGRAIDIAGIGLKSGRRPWVRWRA